MNNKLVINTTLLRKESEFKTRTCVVEKAIAVPLSEFENLKRHPLQDNDLIAENTDLMYCDSDDIDCEEKEYQRMLASLREIKNNERE